MKIERDREFETFWMKELKNVPQRRRESSETIHVYDLTFCLKKAFFNIMGPPDTEDEDDKSAMYKIIGKAHHGALQILRGHLAEAEINKYGVTGTIDLFETIPIEIKSTRKFIETASDISPHYLRQLSYYCVMTDNLEGKLAILDVVRACFVVFNITYSQDEFNKNREEFFGRRDLLLKAVRENNVNIIPYPSTNERWQCKGCRKAKFCEAAQRDHDNGV